MTLQICSTKWLLSDSVAPTSQSVTYPYEGETHMIKPFTWWVDTDSNDLYYCFSNDGITALWKKVTSAGV